MGPAVLAYESGDVAAVILGARENGEDLVAARIGVLCKLALRKLAKQAASGRAAALRLRVEPREQLVGNADHDLGHDFSIYRYCQL
jgi:hypothetical protein